MDFASRSPPKLSDLTVSGAKKLTKTVGAVGAVGGDLLGAVGAVGDLLGLSPAELADNAAPPEMSDLMLECESGNKKAVRNELAADTLGVNYQHPESKLTALLVASSEGYDEIVGLLVGCGASLEITNAEGETGLMWACSNGHTDCVIAYLRLDRYANAADDAALWPQGVDAATRRETAAARTMAGRTWAEREVLLQLQRYRIEETSASDDKAYATLLDALADLDEEELSRLAAYSSPVFRSFGMQDESQAAVALDDVSRGEAFMSVYSLATAAADYAGELACMDPHAAEEQEGLSSRMQLAAVALLMQLCDEKSGRGGSVLEQQNLDGALRSSSGHEALEMAVTAGHNELFSQHAIVMHILREWRGELLDEALQEKSVRRYYSKLLAILFLLSIQLPLLPLIALMPNVDSYFRRVQMPSLMRLMGFRCKKPYVLHAPNSKFLVAWLCELLLALCLTFIPADQLRYGTLDDHYIQLETRFRTGYDMKNVIDEPMALHGAPGSKDGGILTAYVLIVWLSTGLVWEIRALLEGGLDAYLAITFNRVDAPALILSLAGVLVALYGESTSLVPVLLSMGCLLQWSRLLRVFLVQSSLGPFVLMVFIMAGDVVLFLVLHLCVLVCFTSASVKMFEPDTPVTHIDRDQFGTTEWPEWADPSDYAGCEGVDGRVFSTWGDSFFTLVEGSLVSDGFFDCVRESSRPYALPLMYLYFCLTTLLALNLLIAMMAKTFDNIYESSTSQYLFLFAQTTLELIEAPPTPPPFYFFSIPGDVIANGVPWLMEKIRTSCDGIPDEKPDAEMPAFFPEDSRFVQYRDTLAKQVNDYIIEYQDDVAPEGRFRTALNKTMTERHHKQMTDNARRSEQVHEEIAKVHNRMDEMRDDFRRVVDEIKIALLVRLQTDAPTLANAALRTPTASDGQRLPGASDLPDDTKPIQRPSLDMTLADAMGDDDAKPVQRPSLDLTLADADDDDEWGDGQSAEDDEEADASEDAENEDAEEYALAMAEAMAGVMVDEEGDGAEAQMTAGDVVAEPDIVAAEEAARELVGAEIASLEFDKLMTAMAKRLSPVPAPAMASAVAPAAALTVAAALIPAPVASLPLALAAPSPAAAPAPVAASPPATGEPSEEMASADATSKTAAGLGREVGQAPLVLSSKPPPQKKMYWL